MNAKVIWSVWAKHKLEVQLKGGDAAMFVLADRSGGGLGDFST